MSWTRAAIKVGLALATGVLAAGALATPARADISGPCEATGYASPGTGAIHSAKEATAAGASTIDVKTNDVWHVTEGSTLSGSGHADPEQTQGHAEAGAFGIFVTIASGSGKGHDGSAGPLKVSDLATYTDRIEVTGGSDSCSGDLLIIVDGKNPLTTVAGGGAAVITVVCAAGTAAIAARRRPIPVPPGGN